MSQPETQKPAGRGRAFTNRNADDDGENIMAAAKAVNAPADPRFEAVLADLRRSSGWYRYAAAAVEAIGVNLKGGFIDVNRALDEMRDLGLPILMDWQPGASIGERDAA